MTDQNTELQVDGDEGATPPAETSSGESDLDTLMKEFEESQQQQQKPTSEPTPPDKTAPSQGTQFGQPKTGDAALKKLAPVIEFAQGEMTRRAEEELKADLDKAVEFLKEADELKEAPDRLIRGLAEAYAQEDPDFGKAFQERKTDAKKWQSALGNARNWAIETVKEWPGNTVRSEVEAAVASARKTSTKQPEQEDKFTPTQKAKMSDQEWSAYLEEQTQEAAQL